MEEFAEEAIDGGRWEEASAASYVVSAVEGKVWEGTIDLSSIDRSAHDHLVPPPSVVCAATIGAQGTAEVRGGVGDDRVLEAEFL